MNVAILIPAYNAAESLPSLLEQTLRFSSRENIVVVNDGSTDSTASVIETFSVTSCTHAKNQGKGAALQTGFDFVLNKGFDAVITMDADLQHQPAEIPNFITMHSVAHSDVIIGSRLHDTKGMPPHRLLSNTLTTLLVRMRTGKDIQDSQSGFRFITQRVLENVRLSSSGFEAETEFLIKAAVKGFSFGSIPIRTVYGGAKSHMTHFRTTINFLRVLLRQY